MRVCGKVRSDEGVGVGPGRAGDWRRRRTRGGREFVVPYRPETCVFFLQEG